MFMTYLMSYVLCLIHLMYFYLMLGRVMLTCDSFSLVGWTSTPKGGQYAKGLISDHAQEQTGYADSAAHLRHSSIDLAMSSKGGDGSSQLI